MVAHPVAVVRSEVSPERELATDLRPAAAYSARVASGVEERERADPAVRRARSVLAVALATASAVLLAVGAAGVDRWPPLDPRPADRFPESPGGLATITFHEVAVGDTALVVMAYADGPVRLEDVEPVIGEDAALVTVEVLACRAQPEGPHVGGTLNDDLRTYCTDVHRPTEVELGGEDDVYLVALIRALEPGVAYVDGIRVTHARGPFHRTEHTGQGVELNVR